MVPLVLAVSRRWRCFAAAAATVALLALATTAAFGPQIWHAFLDSTRFTRLIALEQGNTGWYKIQSVFSWARMWGASIPLAYMFQGALAAALAAALVAVWRGAAPYPFKAAALCLAAILATPHTFDYDMMVPRLPSPSSPPTDSRGFDRGRRRWPRCGCLRAQCHTSDTCSFRRCSDARNVCSLVAAHHERFHLAAGFL
jgi:hypothetical protein